MTVLGTRYLEHLSDRDLAFLAETAEPSLGDEKDATRALRARPELIQPLLGRPEVHGHLFGAPGFDPLTSVSPFLTFAVLVHHCARELEGLPFVREWVGPRRRVPVFDTPRLVEFLEDSEYRFFLAELMGSYTHVASGGMWVRSAKGWRRHRFSELDPVRLASLLELVPDEDRPGIYRRLGDLALFLTGLFPDHSATGALSPVDAARLSRIAHGPHEPGRGSEPAASLQLLEELGRRCYRMAAETVPSPQPVGARVVAGIAERFDQARRILNFIAERYLFTARNRWFPGPAG